MKIWGRKNSINVQKVMWAVGELGLAHERVDAGMSHGVVGEAFYGELNPNRQVPTLDDDGLILWESNVIVRYLAAKHAAGAMMPGDMAARAQAEMWMDWQQTTISPLIRPIFWGLVRTPEAERNHDEINAAVAALGAAFQILDRQLDGRAYIMGDALTVADIPLGCVAYRWFALPVEHGENTNVRAWYERLASRAAFKEHVMLPVT